MVKKHLWTTAFIGLAINACAPQSEHFSEETPRIANELGCSDAETRFFDRLIDGDLADQTKNPNSVRNELIDRLTKEWGDHAAIQDLDRALGFLLEEAPVRLGKSDVESLKRLYAAIEFGSSNEDIEGQLAREYEAKYHAAWKAIQIKATCLAPPRTTAKALAVTAFDGSTLPLPVRGMKWAFATAYQSCEVLTQTPLTVESPDVKGITENGHHPDGIGRRRFITNLGAVQSTHPYLHEPPTSACLDIRKNPLIYDYGGRPFIDTDSIDLHRNAGSGTSVLGIDCSAYVGTALATAGLKTKSSVPLRPAQAGLYSSHDFLNPEGSKFDCMARIPLSPTESVKNGDIVAVAGHVFMLDQIGADPFGFSSATKVEDCARLSSDNFNFVISQSSNSKNGVGLNRYFARDYVKNDHQVIKAGLEKYAVQACKNHLTNTTSTPKYSDLAISRHKGTAACIDTRVPIARETCLNSCFERRSLKSSPKVSGYLGR